MVSLTPLSTTPSPACCLHYGGPIDRCRVRQRDVPKIRTSWSRRSATQYPLIPSQTREEMCRRCSAGRSGVYGMLTGPKCWPEAAGGPFDSNYRSHEYDCYRDFCIGFPTAHEYLGSDDDYP